jgi:hypothetical protein
MSAHETGLLGAPADRLDLVETQERDVGGGNAEDVKRFESRVGGARIHVGREERLSGLVRAVRPADVTRAGKRGQVLGDLRDGRRRAEDA